MYRFFCDSTPSTNDLAKAHARDGGDLPALFVARRQSAGRGRMGHTFMSETGGLYMSLVFRPQVSAAQSVRLTAYAAAVCARVLEDLCGAQVDIKWVNDLIMGGKKVGGILTEGSLTDSGDLAYAVIGIGINLLHVDFPSELAPIATSVEDVTGVRLSADDVARTLAEALLAGDPWAPQVTEDYRRRCCTVGKAVTVLRGTEQFDAFAVAIGDDCTLTVRREDGRTEVLSSGEARVRPCP